MDQGLENLTARDLVAGLRSGRWTSVELTRHYLERIRDRNPGIHAVPYFFEIEALAQARESDARRASGAALSELDGLPMTIKDTIRIRGLPSTYGIWFLRNHRPRTDSRLIEVLRESGVVFLGRTAVPTGGFDWNCRNRVYPECVNPLDPTRVPGGSSGGAAAALATGMTSLELGSDLAGSIRYPSHCCGVYGLRTTDGWLPIDDIGPEGYATGFRQLVTVGPMARNLEDLDLLLSRFAEFFPGQREFESLPEAGPLKIAYSPDILGLPAEPATQALLERFLDECGRQGHAVVRACPDVDFEELYRYGGVIAGYEYASALPPLARARGLKKIHAWWMLEHRLGEGPFTGYFRRGMEAAEPEYRQALELRIGTFDAVERFFREFALWILPVAPAAAIPRRLCGKKMMTSRGEVEYSRYIASYMLPTSVLGTPALTRPVGVDEYGMPIGVQIHGPRFSDRWLVRVALARTLTRTAERLDCGGMVEAPFNLQGLRSSESGPRLRGSS